ELKKILKNQIAGIDINEEAARITAFSLCLSMLHYLEPPSIQEQIKQGNRLPKLLVSKSRSSEHYHCILVGNAFDKSIFTDNVLLAQKFGNECIDIIVGNPPWGAVAKSHEQAMLEWCRIKNKPVGDKEQSQAFILRALDFLKKNGKAGMLVSAGVLFKHSETTQLFRKEWLKGARLREIYNFTHVRKFFFNGATSPFLMVNFEKAKQADYPVLYASAKQTVMLDKMQVVLFSKYDFNWIQDSDLSSSKLWKSYWFGRTLDNVFLSELSVLKKPLLSFIDRSVSGQGLVLSPEKYSIEQLGFRDFLDPSSFDKFSDSSSFVFKQLPRKIYRLGQKGIFSGKRILVKRGIDEATFPKGQLVARYEDSSFCFTNAINGLKLQEPAEWKYKTILGILWSSFSRYYFFMTASTWGLWHHEIHLDDELLQIPVVLDKGNPATKAIISVVDELRSYHPTKQDILNPNGIFNETIKANRRKLEAKLDETVFKLYELNDEQKDLIRDCCEVTLPFFYQPLDSVGSQQAVRNNDLSWIESYVNIFARRWNIYLDDDEEMHAKVHIGAHENIVALEFYPADKRSKRILKLNDELLKDILEQIRVYLPQPMGVSQIILDGLIYVVSKSGIIIVKRNEKRFWTRSLAREDADTTLAKVMAKGMPREKKR
ncbi:MAG: N-6 DNA methylase, partial [Bacteroidota bacterium]